MPLPSLVLVEWVDATCRTNWREVTDVKEWARDVSQFLVHDVGYLVVDDPDFLVIAARLQVDVDGDDRQVGLYERIPRGCVRRVVVLDPRAGDG